MAFLTDAEQLRSLVQYLPSGRAFGAKDIEGSVTRQLLQGLVAELQRADFNTCELRTGTLPDQTLLFLAEWESALQIPDDCFIELGASDDLRRRDILIKLASLGVQTAADFENLVLLFNITGSTFPWTWPITWPLTISATVMSGANVAFDTWPSTVPVVSGGAPSAVERRFIIVVDLSYPEGQQTWNWVWKNGVHPWSDPTTTLIRCLFDKLAPANVQVVFLTSGAA